MEGGREGGRKKKGGRKEGGREGGRKEGGRRREEEGGGGRRREGVSQAPQALLYNIILEGASKVLAFLLFEGGEDLGRGR